MKKIMTFALIALATSASYANQELATSKGCLACHAPDKELIGPSYKDVAAKYKGQKDAVSILAKNVKNGTKGNWPNLKYKGGMPPNAVSDAEAEQLVKWIMSQK